MNDDLQWKINSMDEVKRLQQFMYKRMTERWGWALEEAERESWETTKIWVNSVNEVAKEDGEGMTDAIWFPEAI